VLPPLLQCQKLFACVATAPRPSVSDTGVETPERVELIRERWPKPMSLTLQLCREKPKAAE